MAIPASFGVAALGWLASPVVKDLVTKSITYLGSDIAEGLEDLETTLLPQFQLTMQAAQNSPHAIDLKKWLLRLKNAYYDAEGILHDLEYKRLRRKVKGEQRKIWMRISSHPIIRPLGKFTSKVNKKVSLLSPKKKQLLHRLNKLKRIAAEAKTLRKLLTSTVSMNENGRTSDNNPPVTSSLLPHRVFGRDGDRDQIIEFLLHEDEQWGSSSGSSSAIIRSYPVVAITGIGGCGKTTLAQYVYNDPRVTEHFGTRMWISLSQYKDIMERTKEMIECITKENSSHSSNFNELQKKLMNALLSESKGVLLVLDNFWLGDTKAAEDKQWEDLLAPFTCIRGRFKILSTSRSDKFPASLFPWEHIKLSDLAYTDFLSLFRYYAGLEINGPQLQNGLYYATGDRIANKLCKSPLAARVVGDQLYRNRDIGFWQNTAKDVNLSDIMNVLLWSYQRMDGQIQRCFLYCGMFPRGTWFTDNMMQNWLALDFIKPAVGDKRTAQQIGFEFSQMMVGNSIFQMIGQAYVMYDLFHDLAEKLCADDCFRVTDAEKDIPSSTLHLYLKGNIENLSGISNLRNLRSLILNNLVIRDMSNMFSMLPLYFKNLRVLEIISSSCETLPRTVGNLRNLRILNISASLIKKLPNSICQLYHLQYLLLPESVKILPEKLCNLINLRSILILRTSGAWTFLLPPVPYLGRLNKLQYLPEFHVRKQKGYKLTQLGCLRDITGILTILNLENVRDEDEAIGARLIDKSELNGLQLVWTESADRAVTDFEVIEALRPPSNLEFLAIDGYRGSRYPTWLREDSILLNLKSIGFYNCNALKVVPSGFNQLHHCHKLVLSNLGALRELSAFPESLATLKIIECPCLILVDEDELQQLQVDENQVIMARRFFVFPSYGAHRVLDHEFKSFEQTGSVENCLEQLTIIGSVVQGNYAYRNWKRAERAWQRCHQQRMNFIFSGTNRANKLKLPANLCILQLEYCCISDGALSDCLRGMNFLKMLHLEGIMTITALPPADVMQSLRSLQFVQIICCWSLISLGGLHALPGLLNFQLQGCSRLQIKSDSAQLPPTLQSVTIVQCIIDGNILYGNFACLQYVTISICITPDSLSFHHLNSLQSLYLKTCPSRLIRLCPIIDTLYLELPYLDVQSVVESWQGCRELHTSSLMMLNKLLLLESFVAPIYLTIMSCQEEAISFEKSVHLQSIKALRFQKCETKNLPTSLRDFSNLEHIDFDSCPDISELPVLPSSVQTIVVKYCPVLRERCQPNGLDWYKIQHIKTNLAAQMFQWQASILLLKTKRKLHQRREGIHNGCTSQLLNHCSETRRVDMYEDGVAAVVWFMTTNGRGGSSTATGVGGFFLYSVCSSHVCMYVNNGGGQADILCVQGNSSLTVLRKTSS